MPLRRAVRGVALAVGLAAAAAAAQTPSDLAPGTPVAAAPGILTVDQDRLYSGSRFGQKMLADLDAETRALQAENRRIEAALEAEERLLTERRATVPAEEFRILAASFDKRVKDIRAARDAKARDLTRRREEAQKTFLNTAVPILAAILTETGASAIIDRQAIILSFDRIDVTDLAIARIDATLPPDPAPDAPQTDAPPTDASPTDPPPPDPPPPGTADPAPQD